LSNSGWDVVGFSNGPEAGTKPSLYKGSVTELEKLRAVFHQEKPGACVHLAGLAHATVSRDEFESVRQINVSGALNVAKAAADAGVRQFVFFSTAKIYGDTTPAEGIDEDTDPNPDGIYAELKYEAEQRLSEMAAKADMGLVIIRPVAVFGPGDSRGNYARLIRAARRGIFPVVAGGHARRSIVFLNRVSERIDRILGTAFISGRIYVFSDGIFELKEILNSIRRATGTAFFPSIPEGLANSVGSFTDWVWEKATGKPGPSKQALMRLTSHFVICAHHYDSDFGPLERFDLDGAFKSACASVTKTGLRRR
jgi:nucleoside-diphosphate-sugar epimerase